MKITKKQYKIWYLTQLLFLVSTAFSNWSLVPASLAASASLMVTWSMIKIIWTPEPLN